MKGNLLQGTAKGRMGEIVASVRHGKQLFSKYQPNVLNPKSFKQMQQRELFANATAFTKDFFSSGLLCFASFLLLLLGIFFYLPVIAFDIPIILYFL